MIRKCADRVRLRVTGAVPTVCLNRLTLARIGFWDLQWLDALTLELTVSAKDAPEAKRLIRCCQCDVTEEFYPGINAGLKKLLGRPVLLAGLLLAVLAPILLQNFVWTVRVEGNAEIPAEQILQEIQTYGVKFGAWGPGIDSQSVKNKMLNAIPKLRWLAVNRSGGCVTVMVSEREPEAEVRDPDLISNVVASRTGIITEMHVLSGMPVTLVGDPVVTGQLLVSGFIEFDDHVQYTTALAEIYAQTLYQPSLRLPGEDLKKTYTGRVSRQVVLIFGNKRIKIKGNSSIFPTGCDKMVYRKDCTLPGGYQFPLALEITVCREYEQTPLELSQETVQRRMEQALSELVTQSMIAGQIRELSCQVKKEQTYYTASGTVFCEEMIARIVPIQMTGDEPYGENRQR